MSVNTKGHQKMPLAKSTSVGGQGNGASTSGASVDMVGGATPKMSPKKIGGSLGGLQKAPIQPKVGK
jgi:hypothetical protein